MAGEIAERTHLQEDGDRLRDLIVEISSVKDIARRWQPTSLPVRKAGLRLEDDLPKMEELHDHILTRLPIGCEAMLKENIKMAADDLDKAIKQIANRDTSGWNLALATLQMLLPKLEEAERSFRSQMILYK